MKNNLSHSFYIGFSENGLYYLNFSIFIKLVNNSIKIRTDDKIISHKIPTDFDIPLDEFPDFFTDLIFIAISFIEKDFIKNNSSVDLRYTSISKDGIDNMDHIIQSIRLQKCSYENSQLKTVNFPKGIIFEDILNFSRTSLSKIFKKSKQNTEILINFNIADPKFIK
uniref:Uncharacterized protein n=1 Tax=Orbilia oligospora TaxID=2813651 RepID=A0A481ZNH2_ORBOL|nr:hypothetical protein [Orbilia oligospora]QBL02018.1 hypothetical protein [Orbilia oligospora]